MIDLGNRKGSCAKALCTILVILLIIGMLCWKAWNQFCSYIHEEHEKGESKATGYVTVESGICVVDYKKLSNAIIYMREETIDQIGKQLFESREFTIVTKPLYDYNYESGNLGDARNEIPSVDASNALDYYARLLCHNKYPNYGINEVAYKMRYGTYIYPRGGFNCQSDKSKLKALEDNEPVYHVRGPGGLDTQCALALNEFNDLKQKIYTELNRFGSAFVIKGIKAGMDKHFRNVDRDDGYDE